MKRSIPLVVAGMAAAAIGGATLVPVASTATNTNAGAVSNGQRAFGLGVQGTKLVTFTLNAPQQARALASITGLDIDTALAGIDFRVQDRALYGVGNAGGVYKISTTTGAATLVNRLTIAVNGDVTAVDFNPAADRLRVITSTGQNLRHNVNAGGVTLNDGTLTYTALPAAAVAATGINGAAYTNNDVEDAASAKTGTTLFNLDTTLDQIALQSPANTGLLVATGKLGADAATLGGLDIYSDLTGGVTTSNTAYAVLSASGSTALYSVNVLTGVAKRLGGIPAGLRVTDLAVVLEK